MKILFLTRRAWPEVGGVEIHVLKVSQSLKKLGHKVTTISEKDIKHPKVKFFGLLYIWQWLFINRKLIESHDVVHCHDVFIWYLPFRFLYYKKPVYLTSHGWEGAYPVPFKNILLKKISNSLAWGSIGIGKYIEKHYGVTFTKTLYGAVSMNRFIDTKNKTRNSIVFVGRLELDTGLAEFLKHLKGNKYSRVEFCGDGEMREECEKFGKVHGFCDPTPFYKKAEYCVPGGYLAALEALSYNCKLKLFWNNKVKEDYWKMSPFYKLKGKKLKAWAREQTWDKLANKYLSLYRSS